MLYHVLSQRFCSQQPPKKILYKSQSLRKNSSNLHFSHLLGGKSPFSFRKKPTNPPIFAATLPRCGGPVRCPRHVSYVGNKPDTFQIYQQNGKVPMSVSNMGKCNGGIIMLGLFMGYVPSGNQTWQRKMANLSMVFPAINLHF